MKRLTLFVSLLAGLISGLALNPSLAASGLAHLPDELADAFSQQQARVDSDSDQREAVIAAGRERAIFCNTCHGRDGNATRAGYPSLAGQSAVYLLDQIEQFATGDREKLVMNVLAETFSIDEKITLALYYANVELADTDYDLDLALAGAPVYQLRCAACHGADGRGTEGYARIAGQQASYVAKVLREYRGGNSPRRPSVMYGIANALSDQDIETVSHYVASGLRGD
ncbi:MAG: c-type cytochrome [Wenzhouxiangella sp.]